MLSHQIQNTNVLCSTLHNLLHDDIEYLKSHPNPKYYWGNHTDNIIAKFYQFDDLVTLPMFDQLSVSDLKLEVINLYYIKPDTTKILYNTNSETKEINKASIIIPLGHTSDSGFSSYLWYDPHYVKRDHQIKDFPGLYKTHGIRIVQDSHVFESDTPIIVKHQNAWSGIYNKENTEPLVFLHLAFAGNPDYEKIKSIF